MKDIDTRAIMAEAKFYEGYSRWNEVEDRYETWEESVSRVMNMHRTYYKDKMTDELSQLIDEAEALYKLKYVLGAQRALQFGGDQILKHNLRMFNCLSSYADRPAFFGEFFFSLLCGCGVGFSVQQHHIAKLPNIVMRKGQAKIHVVEDSIEGWATALDVLMSSYFETDSKYVEYQGRKVYFDLNSIRPKGALISGGFKAPGPEPLRRALDKIEHIMQGIVLSDKHELQSIHVYDICMHTADAVLSGGVRRSATLCMFSSDDNSMIQAKTGNWYEENPQRGRSNNSAVIVRNSITKEDFSNIMKSIKQFGEPGFIFVESTEHTFNPCSEIGKYPVWINEKDEKLSGFQGCVSYDTKLITKDGIEIIGDVVKNKNEIEIWNGNNWNKVKPFKTGENKELYRVGFSDGSFLDCTNNHKFVAKYKAWNDYEEFELKDIINISKTEPFHREQDAYRWHLPRPNISQEFEGTYESHAYEYGWVLGDGTAHNSRPWGEIYEAEYDIIDLLDCTVGKEVIKEEKFQNFKRVYINNVDGKFSEKLKYDIGLPKEVFQWDRESIKQFVYGWIDSDGSTNGRGFRIYGREDKIRDGQLLLTKLGVISKVCLMSSAGEETNFATRKNDVWYLNVVDCNDLTGKYKTFKRDKMIRSLKITQIEKLDGLHDSYCFEESELHQGVFNNVLTKQCNLSEINGSKCTTKEEFFRACRVGSILGTLQAGYTNFTFLSDISKKIFDREALIGVSVTGWMNNPDVLFDEDTLREGARIVKKVNRNVAKLININPAARTTCTKPSGNASVILGTSSGIHGDHSPRYIRNVQMNVEQEVLQLIKESNPYMVEDSRWSSGNTDSIISFPVIAPAGSIFKKDLYGIKLLEKVRLVQNSWVEEGTDESLCVDPTVRHNVSNTVQVHDDQWAEIEEYLFKNKYSFAGVSFLSATGDKDFVQAPFIEVLTEEELIKNHGRAAFFASGLIVESSKGFADLWTATTKAQFDDTQLSGEQYDLGADWIRRFRKFADNYFDGDRKKAEYCLKDVYILHKWVKIQQNMNPINFDIGLQKRSYTNIDTMSAQSCHGGGCEI